SGYPSVSPADTFGSPPLLPMLGPGFTPKEGSQKRKRTPFKMDTQEAESPERGTREAADCPSKKPPDVPNFSIQAHPISSPSPKSIPGMIELSRLHLRHRLPGLNVPVPLKQEPLSPPVWPPPPFLLHSPYFPSLPHSLLPYPIFMPNPVIPLSPGSFYTRDDLRSRRRSQDAAPRCGTTAAEKLNLSVHVDDSYYVDVGGDQKRWKCRMCEKSYTSKYNLVTHILGHNGIKPHGCHLCGKLFKQLSHLHTHLLTHQGMRPHKCQVCHKAFTQTSHLKRHMMQHSDVKPYSCSVCSRGFAYPSELRAHELKHEKGQENVCVECGLDFPTLAQLKRHLTTHRGPTLYRCSECQKTFQYPSQLQNHMMKHKDIRPYICSECGMEFIQSHHLKQHTLTHKGVKEHKCRICGREFTLLANMKRHVLIHTNIRAYQCHMCFKSFVQKQTLKAHMIVHSDIKPYKCKLCGKEFNRMHNLMGHMHLHSDSKPFKCLYCSSKFTLKGNLTRHMKVKHGVMDRGLDERPKRSPLTFPRSLRACPPTASPSRTARASLEARARRRMRRAYSPEVDQHDQVERQHASAARWRGDVLKGPSGERRTYDREPATDEETTGDKAHLSQRQETPSDSEPEAGNQVGPGRSKGEDSDSEPGDRQQGLNEPPIRVKREEGEKNQSRVDFTVIKAPPNEDME
uniref:Zinc finger protein 710 n=1 Tax=Tetraodon nigroviridis TaxID=99883 RepID=H3DGZ5_TETNG